MIILCKTITHLHYPPKITNGKIYCNYSDETRCAPGIISMISYILIFPLKIEVYIIFPLKREVYNTIFPLKREVYLRLQIGVSKTRAYYVWGLRTPSKFITNLPLAKLPSDL